MGDGVFAQLGAAFWTDMFVHLIAIPFYCFIINSSYCSWRRLRRLFRKNNS